MSEQKMEELKPCPFCGSAPAIFASCDHSTAWEGGCGNEGCNIQPHVWEPTKELAYEAWNRRAAPPAMETVRVPARQDDRHIDALLMTAIPGGSNARDWFLPHDSEKAKANIRDVVRRMLARHQGLQAAAAERERATVEALLASLYGDIERLTDEREFDDDKDRDQKITLYREARKVFPVILEPRNKGDAAAPPAAHEGELVRRLRRVAHCMEQGYRMSLDERRIVLEAAAALDKKA